MSEPPVFSKRFEVRWADLDAHGHLPNTASLDHATHVRLVSLAESGFPPSRCGEPQS